MSSLAWEWASRELAALPRREHFHRRRLGWVLIGGLGVWVCTFLARAFPGTPVALYLFQYLSVAAWLILVPSAMVASGHTFQVERDSGSLGLLALTDATAGELLHGRLTARYLATLVAILSLLPLVILLIPLGGLWVEQVVAAGAVLCAAAYLAHAIGLWTAARSAGRGTLWLCLAGLASAVWIILPLAAQAALGRVAGFQDVGVWCSPLLALYRLTSPDDIPLAIVSAVFGLALGTAFLFAARRTLDRRLRDGRWVVGPPADTVRVPSGSRFPRRVSWRPDSFMPLYHRDVAIAYGGGQGAWLTVLVGCLPLLLGLFGGLPEGRQMGCLGSGVFLLGMFFLMVLYLSCNAFEVERRDRVLELLLVAGMRLDRMVFEKLLSVGRVLWPIPLASLACLAAGRLGYRHSWGETSILFLFDLTVMSVAYAFLGVCLSLRYPRMKALAVCLVIFLLWNAVGRVSCMVFVPVLTAGAAFLFVDTAFHVEIVLIGAIIAEHTLARWRHGVWADPIRVAATEEETRETKSVPVGGAVPGRDGSRGAA